MLTYFFAIQICLLFLWMIYHWGIGTLPNYRFNRLFLWLIPLLSISIPLLEIELTQGVEIIEAKLSTHPSENDRVIASNEISSADILQEEKSGNINWLISILYGVGVGLMLSKSLSPVLRLRQRLAESKLIMVQFPNVFAQQFFPSSFAFGKRIYLGSDWKALEPNEGELVLQHEQAHIRMKHSYDLYYFHLIRALFWFHPAAHLLLRSAKHLHEFQADQFVLNSGSEFSKYAQVLLKLQSKQKVPAPFSFAFAEHPLKTRIKMLKTKKSIFQSSKHYLIAILLIGSLITGIGYYFNSFAWLQLQISVGEPISNESQKPSVEELIETNPEITDLQTFSHFNPNIPEYQPIDAKMVSGFGMRIHPILKTEKLHRGIDYYAPIGTVVKASADAKVIFVSNEKGGENDNYGVQIILQHANGYQTRYAHLDQFLVEKGQLVKQGEEIARSGNTGLSNRPHLHYELIKNGRPIDPMPLFKSLAEKELK